MGFEQTVSATLPADQATLTREKPADRIGIRRGTLLGRYVVLDELGRGGMGAVYSAFDPELDRRVALKVLRPAVGGTPGQASVARARLLREAQAMAKLSHPNVITVYDVGTFDDDVFIAMELIEGSTLTRWLRRERRGWRDVVATLFAAGRGLAAAHRSGLVHRDFKPDNVLVSDDGRVLVLDFGLATAADRETQNSRGQGPVSASGWGAVLTETGALVGTPAYMAPEQFLHERVDARTDQYSFCVTAYEALAGARPLAAGSLQELAWAVTQDDISGFPGGVRAPGWVRRAILRGLARQPAERWPDMDALLRELGRDPSRGRKRWMVAAAMGLAGAVAVGKTIVDKRRVEVECDLAGHELEGVWGDHAQMRVQAAFEATGRPSADRAFEATRVELDQYLASWGDIRRRACRGFRVDGSILASEHAEQTRCLTYARRQLEAWLDVLSEADAGVVDHAISGVRDQFRVEVCSDPEKVRHQIPAPPDPTQAARVAAIRAAITRAQALQSMGRLEAGKVIAEDALAQARSLDYAPIVAEALLTVAQSEHWFDRPSAAEAALRETIAVAQKAGHSRVAAKAWVSWIFEAGMRLRRWDEALRFEPIARAAVERTDPETLEPLLEASLGGVYLSRMDHDNALLHHLRAVELVRKREGDRSFDLVRPLSGLGVTYNVRWELEQGHATFHEALAIAERTLGESHPTTAKLRVNLGATLEYRGLLREAREQFEKALAIHRLLSSSTHPDLANTVRGLGSVVLESGRPAEALPILQEAVAILERAEEPNKAMLAWALRSVGEALIALERPAEALPPLTRAAGLIPDRPVMLAMVYVHLARSYAASGRPEVAREQLEAARALIAKDDQVLFDVGKLELELGLVREAIPHLRRSLEPSSFSAEGRVLRQLELGKALRKVGNREEARLLFEQALEGAQTERLQAYAQTALARSLARTDQTRARRLLDEALEGAERSDDVALQREIAELRRGS